MLQWQDPALLTAEQCHGAAREEGLVLKTQEDHVARGPMKQNETGFGSVHLKKGQNARYFGIKGASCVPRLPPSALHLPEQVALTVARYHARMKAGIVQLLAAHLGPVQASAVRALGGDETGHASVEALQVWCYQRGLDMFATLSELKSRLRVFSQVFFVCSIV